MALESAVDRTSNPKDNVAEVEELSAKLHEIYQTEAKRQGNARHSDVYADLSENTKEYDRVLARYILRVIEETRAETLAQYTSASGPHRHWQDRAVAAEAEVERLRDARLRSRRALDHEIKDGLLADVASLRAEVERLRDLVTDTGP